jgi:hypothetical protein
LICHQNWATCGFLAMSLLVCFFWVHKQAMGKSFFFFRARVPQHDLDINKLN